MNQTPRPDSSVEHFLAVADLLPYPLLLVSTGGVVRAANRAAGAELGAPVADLTGKPLSSLCPADDPDALREYLRRCSATRHPLPGALTCAKPAEARWRVDGALFRPRSNSDPALVLLRWTRRERSVSQFVLLNRKIDELGRAVARRMRVEREREEILRREQIARMQAEAANRTKDDFLATLSHELRTPLNAILGWTRMLRSDHFEHERAAKALEIIERNARAQAQLIEDLLDLSRIESGRLRLQRTPVAVVPVVEMALDSGRPAAENKQIQLVAEVEDTSLVVTADAARLQQVFWNLISNAVKFTPQHGRVTVRLDRMLEHARFTVTDTGEGFGPDVRPFLFQRFWQANQSVYRPHGGLGLGLAIVRHLVEAHGGMVDAQSPGPGLGATFTVLLPIRAAEEEST